MNKQTQLGTILALTVLLAAGCDDGQPAAQPDAGPALHFDAAADSAAPAPDAAPNADLYYPPLPDGPPGCHKPDGGAAADSGAAPDSGPTRVNSPAWEVAEVQVFAAPLGTAASNYAQGLQVLKTALSQHMYYSNACYGFGPLKQHAPPYGGELAAGIKAAGYTPGASFTTLDLTAPYGLHFLFTVAPTAAAPWGKSTDYDCGPILPDSLFSLSFDGDLYRDGKLVDKDFDEGFCGLGPLTYGFLNQDYSHVHLAYAENSDYITPLAGSYEFRYKILDSQGNGYSGAKTFEVK